MKHLFSLLAASFATARAGSGCNEVVKDVPLLLTAMWNSDLEIWAIFKTHHSICIYICVYYTHVLMHRRKHCVLR